MNHYSFRHGHDKLLRFLPILNTNDTLRGFDPDSHLFTPTTYDIIEILSAVFFTNRISPLCNVRFTQKATNGPFFWNPFCCFTLESYFQVKYFSDFPRRWFSGFKPSDIFIKRILDCRPKCLSDDRAMYKPKKKIILKEHTMYLSQSIWLKYEYNPLLLQIA